MSKRIRKPLFTESIKARLEAAGCTIEQWQFEEIVQEVFAVMCPDITDEEMGYHDDLRAAYLTAIRCRCSCDLPSDLILRTLANLRKSVNRHAD